MNSIVCQFILCPDSQTLRTFFSKSTFHQSFMMSSIKLPYLKEGNDRFQQFLLFTTKLSRKNSHLGNTKKSVSLELLTQLVHFNVLSHLYCSLGNIVLLPISISCTCSFGSVQDPIQPEQPFHKHFPLYWILDKA